MRAVSSDNARFAREWNVAFLLVAAVGGLLLAVGRTRMFCQVSEQVTPLLLARLTVKVICVVVLEVIAAEVPVAAPLTFLLSPPPPASRSIRTVGAVPPVSKANPARAFRMIVPVPTSPLRYS